MSNDSEHRPYFVTTAGVTICEDCTNQQGGGVLWLDAHPDDLERFRHDGTAIRIDR